MIKNFINLLSKNHTNEGKKTLISILANFLKEYNKDKIMSSNYISCLKCLGLKNNKCGYGFKVIVQYYSPGHYRAGKIFDIRPESGQDCPRLKKV
jgi:hypothetical protein